MLQKMFLNKLFSTSEKQSKSNKDQSFITRDYDKLIEKYQRQKKIQSEKLGVHENFVFHADY